MAQLKDFNSDREDFSASLIGRALQIPNSIDSIKLSNLLYKLTFFKKNLWIENGPVFYKTIN